MKDLKGPGPLSPDRALTDPKDDRFGYSPFARHLADSLCRMAPPEGLVVAIYGPWGTGKTTLLNFVSHYIAQKPLSARPVEVSFNPWWFSGHEDLTRRFFQQFRAVLGKRKELARAAVAKLAEFADVVSVAPVPYASGAKVISRIFSRVDEDVATLKASLTDALRKQNKRVLVVIDDIDRLNPEEIRQLFRVVKAVADLPNVIYLMAFDREVVTKALQVTEGVSGEEYLEKIVQTPFELPCPDKAQLRLLFLDRLTGLLADALTDSANDLRLRNILVEGIYHFIETPRDVHRLTNALSVTYPAVRGEVNPGDFLAIETLRVFKPEVYSLIRGNPDMFTGYGSSQFIGPRPEDVKKYHDNWLGQLATKDDLEPLKRLLQRMFPRLDSVWGNEGHSPGEERIWRRDLRICSADIFPVYFRLTLPENSISNSEVRATLSLADDPKSFGNELVRLANQTRPDGTSRVSALLERLADYARSDIALGAVPSVIKAIFDVGDLLMLPGDESQGMGGEGNRTRLGRLTRWLIDRLDRTARMQSLREAISGGRATYWIVYEVSMFRDQQSGYGQKEPDPEDRWIVTKDELAELETLALVKVREAARDGRLLKSPALQLTLDRWREWAGPTEPSEWIGMIVSDDTGLITLLENFASTQYVRLEKDAVGMTQARLDPKWLEPYLAPGQLIERVRRLSKGTALTQDQRVALEQFIREYDMRESGKNPGGPFAFRA